MLSLTANVQIYLCTTPTDMEKSYDGLSALVASAMNQDVLSGHLFLFLNRRRDRIKLLCWDRDGLAIWMKRFDDLRLFTSVATRDGQRDVARPRPLLQPLVGITVTLGAGSVTHLDQPRDIPLQIDVTRVPDAHTSPRAMAVQLPFVDDLAQRDRVPQAAQFARS